MVFRNGIAQQPYVDFSVKHNTVVFTSPPDTGDSVSFNITTSLNMNTIAYTGTGIQTIFNLPYVLEDNAKFKVISNSDDTVPKGYSVVDVDYEIEAWITDNNLPSEWKWADPVKDTKLIAGEFGKIRMIVKDSLLTFIATKWSA